jgi:hypothetical protein
MILTSTLLTLQDITLPQQRKINININPTIGQPNGVKVSNPGSGYELWLSGEFDYVVFEEDMGESENQTPLLQVINYLHFSAPSVSPSGSQAVFLLLYLLYVFLCVFSIFFWNRRPGASSSAIIQDSR